MGEASRDALRAQIEEKRERIKRARSASPADVGAWNAETSLLQTLAILELAEAVEKASKS